MFVAKTLQLLGILMLPSALYAGLLGHSMGKEMLLFTVGVFLFLFGKLLEKKLVKNRTNEQQTTNNKQLPC